MSHVISIKNFSKSFGSKKVIDKLSFEVDKGEIFAFLGANGSGKTTTLRCLLGVYSKDEGELLINGEEYNSEMSGILGYLPEERGLYVNSRVLETLVYFAELKGLSYKDAVGKSRAYLKRVGLEDKEKTDIKKLSSGQQQKIQLGVTIINNPELLILDEPTKGLDPVNRGLLLDILLELNKAGSTIIFSTHQMEEAERIANRLLMIKDGKSALYGKVEEIKASFGNNTIYVNYTGKFPMNDKLYSAKIENNYVELKPIDGVKPKEILNYLVKENIDLSRFEVAAPSLNEIFLEVMKSN